MMASNDGDNLDFSKLQKELDAAVEKDARYWRENDAKIRAVSEQKVASYDEFKDLVAASHLKPLNKGDHIDTISEVVIHPWNPAASRNKETGIVPKSEEKAQDKTGVPKNDQEFARDWQRRVKTAEQRYTYLLTCGAAHLSVLFKTEVSFGLLGDILAALNVFEEKDARAVRDILLSIQQSSRFSLSLQFLSKKEKMVCEQLFEKLLKVADVGNDLAEFRETVCGLQSAYLLV